MGIRGVSPYPEGAERGAINKAFDEFFATLEARETDRGVALASLKGEAGTQESARAKEAAKIFKEDLEASRDGKLAGNAVLRLGETSAALRISGAPSLPIVMTQEKAREIMRADDHGLSLETLAALPEHLADPIMILDSSTQADSLVVVTEPFHEGKPVVAAIHLNSRAGRLEVNQVASVYGKDSAGSFLEKKIGRGKLRYINKTRGFAWSRGLSGLQLPAVMQHAKRLDGKKILTERDLVKTLESERTTRGIAPSLSPGEHLPPGKNVSFRMTARGVSNTVKKLTEQAKNAVPTRVVQSFSGLPEHIRKAYAGRENTLEGVYDPQTKTVWMVADNLTDAERVADVWAHETVVHGGLRSLFAPAQLRTILDKMWVAADGRANGKLMEIADRYRLDVRKRGDQHRAVEEYMANLAEGRREELLNPQEQTFWRRLLNIIRNTWNDLVKAVTGRDTSFALDNVDKLLSALGRHVMEGRPAGRQAAGKEAEASPVLASEQSEAAHAAWEQVRRDTEEWGRQLDDWEKHSAKRQRLLVGSTPDVLKKLGAKAKNMLMMPRNLDKIRNKHGIPLETVKRLPEELADPLMVFKSATMADSLVVLTELEHNGENLIAAIHLNINSGGMFINDIASVHDRAVRDDAGEIVTPGWQWFKGQIEKGNLRYYDKNRSSRWFREQSGLQLPRVINHESYRGIKILTEKDIVKPVAPEAGAEDKPLASLWSKADEIIFKWENGQAASDYGCALKGVPIML